MYVYTGTRTFAVKTVNRRCEAAPSPQLTLRAPPKAQTWWAAFSPGSGGHAWAQCCGPRAPGEQPSECQALSWESNSMEELFLCFLKMSFKWGKD